MAEYISLTVQLKILQQARANLKPFVVELLPGNDGIICVKQ
jgi:hypothetical protein